MEGHLPFSILPVEDRFVENILHAGRLILRPFRTDDAPQVQAHAGNWKVARMTARIPHPYPDGMAEAWIAGHDALRASGDGLALAIEHAGTPIGAIGLERKQSGVYELGYWLGEPWWGRGFATEAARRMVRFAFRGLDAARLVANYHADNNASGRVLEKCGFRYIGDGSSWSASRGREMPVRRLALCRAEAESRWEQA